MVKRCEVYYELDPTRGSEIQKTRPCLVISPDDMNNTLPRVLVAPITSKGQSLGCRPETHLNNRPARILLDQIRSVDKSRLKGKMGVIEKKIWHPVMLEMLA